MRGIIVKVAASIAASIAITVTLASCGAGQSKSVDCCDNDSTILVAVGSYSSPADAGITLMRMNLTNGSIDSVGGVNGVSNPSYMVVSADKRLIYAVSEDGVESAAINVIERLDGDSLVLRGSVPTFGSAPCYINLSPDGKFVLTANYAGGNVTIYRLNQNGMPTGEPQILEFEKGSADTKSNGEPRLHSVTFTPDNQLLLAADLGTDRVYVFPLSGDEDSTLVDAAKMQIVQLEANSGPRHVVYKGENAYIINEISGKVTVMQRSADTFVPVQYIVCDSAGGNGSGDIHFSPDGEYLYASNRLKADGVSVFTVLPDGKLVKTGYLDTGVHPRNFMVTEDWLVVASRDSNRVEVYRRNKDNGIPNAEPVAVMYSRLPVCLKVLE